MNNGAGHYDAEMVIEIVPTVASSAEPLMRVREMQRRLSPSWFDKEAKSFSTGVYWAYPNPGAEFAAIMDVHGCARFYRHFGASQLTAHNGWMLPIHEIGREIRDDVIAYSEMNAVPKWGKVRVTVTLGRLGSTYIPYQLRDLIPSPPQKDMNPLSVRMQESTHKDLKTPLEQTVTLTSEMVPEASLTNESFAGLYYDVAHLIDATYDEGDWRGVYELMIRCAFNSTNPTKIPYL